jgi:type I restriction enzyme R subunit
MKNSRKNKKQKPSGQSWKPLLGIRERLKNLAKDIVTHFEKRQSVFESKAMIVAMSRRIAADLYKAIIAIRPEWHDDDLTKGVIKVVMTTNSADGPDISKHHKRNNAGIWPKE